jgi:rhamnosyltransferase subunit B
LKRILITTFGSFGDLYPYLCIGAELKKRGHAVTIGTSESYRARVEADGLAFHAVRPDMELDNRELVSYLMDARKGSERVVGHVAGLVRESYADTLEAARQADAILTHAITFGSVVVAQKLGIPWISTVLAPITFLSAYDPPVMAPAPQLHGLRVLGPRFMKWFWDLGRRQTLTWLKPVLELRKELGLPPGEHPLFEGSHSPRLVLALFSRELAAPQPDWPANTVVTGFPFYDRGTAPVELERFLAEEPAPVVFTLGSSAVNAAGSFYAESLEAVQRLGCRAVFLTGSHPQGLPEKLPRGVMAVPYAPHGAVFPRTAAVVHQGGIGTTAQAMRSGRPELIVPFGHDQFDNAARVARRGAAEVVYRSRYTSRRVAKAMERLLRQASYQQAAADLGQRVQAENGVAAAADAIEGTLRSSPRP